MFVGLLQYYKTELLIMVVWITVIWKLNSQRFIYIVKELVFFLKNFNTTYFITSKQGSLFL